MGWRLRSLAGPRDDTVMGEHGGRVRGIGDTGPPPAHTSRASARAAPARDGFPIWVGDDGCEEVRLRCTPDAHLQHLRSSEGGPFGTSRGRGQEPSPRSYLDPPQADPLEADGPLSLGSRRRRIFDSTSEVRSKGRDVPWVEGRDVGDEGGGF